jgi:hypothetical protein
VRVLVVFVADFIGFIVFLVTFRVGDDFFAAFFADAILAFSSASGKACNCFRTCCVVKWEA